MSKPKNPANIGRAYRAYLTGGTAQAEAIAQTDGACRLVRSTSIEARQFGYHLAKHSGRTYKPPKSAQITELVNASEWPWMREAPRHAIDQELRKLDAAYKNFFAGRAAYPVPRQKKNGVSITFADSDDWTIRHVAGKMWECRLPKGLGVFRFTKHRGFGGVTKSVTLKSRAGRWQISFAVHERKPKAATKPKSLCAVDLGVAVTAATSQPVDLHGGRGPQRMHRMPDLLSDGEKRRLLGLERHKASQFEALTRRRAKAKKGGRGFVPASKAYLDTVRSIAALHARVGRRRRDWLRKMACALGEFEHVVFEDLKVPNMVKSPAAKPDPDQPGSYLPNGAAASAGLARVILNSGWGYLRTFTGEQTHTLQVPARFSSQECRKCHHTCAENRPDQVTFKCLKCGHENNADLNASEVLEARGRRVLAGDALVVAPVVAGYSPQAPGTKTGLVPAHEPHELGPVREGSAASTAGPTHAPTCRRDAPPSDGGDFTKHFPVMGSAVRIGTLKSVTSTGGGPTCPVR